MHFETRNVGVFEVLAVRLDGLEVFDAGKLRQAVNGLIDDDIRNIVVDLGQLDYLYSDSINAFISINRRMLEVNGRLGVLIESPKVREILLRAGIDNIMRIYRSEGELIADSRELLRHSSALRQESSVDGDGDPIPSHVPGSPVTPGPTGIGYELPRTGGRMAGLPEGAQRQTRRRSGSRIELKSRRSGGRAAFVSGVEAPVHSPMDHGESIIPVSLAPLLKQQGGSAVPPPAKNAPASTGPIATTAAGSASLVRPGLPVSGRPTGPTPGTEPGPASTSGIQKDSFLALFETDVRPTKPATEQSPLPPLGAPPFGTPPQAPPRDIPRPPQNAGSSTVILPPNTRPLPPNAGIRTEEFAAAVAPPFELQAAPVFDDPLPTPDPAANRQPPRAASPNPPPASIPTISLGSATPASAAKPAAPASATGIPAAAPVVSMGPATAPASPSTPPVVSLGSATPSVSAPPVVSLGSASASAPSAKVPPPGPATAPPGAAAGGGPTVVVSAGGSASVSPGPSASTGAAPSNAVSMGSATIAAPASRTDAGRSAERPSMVVLGRTAAARAAEPPPPVVLDDEFEGETEDGSRKKLWIWALVALVLLAIAIAVWALAGSGRSAATDEALPPPTEMISPEAPVAPEETESDIISEEADEPRPPEPAAKPAPARDKGAAAPAAAAPKVAQEPSAPASEGEGEEEDEEDVVTKSVFVTSSPSGAAIYVDGSKSGSTTPADLKLASTSRVLLRKDGYKDLEVAAGKLRGTQVLKPLGGASAAGAPAAASAAEMGKLFISSQPAGAEILVDGRSVGTSPRMVEMSVGSHTVVLKQGALKAERTLDISAGINKAQSFNLN